MSTDDDFETTLRARLHDLADREDGWVDPAPTAREIAAAGIAPDDDPAIVTLAAAHARRRRRWPTLAVAAVLLAFVVGGGLGLRELVRSSGGNATAGAAAGFADAPEDAAGDASSGRAAPGGGPVPTGGSGTGGSGTAGSGSCADLGPATSTGPLAGNGSIRPGGIVGPRVAAGGTVEVPYELSFASAGDAVVVQAPRVDLVVDGRLVATTGELGSMAVQTLPVQPGVAESGSVTFHATDCEGQPLPAGEYQVAVVYSYLTPPSAGDTGAQSLLVSAPLLAVVS